MRDGFITRQINIPEREVDNLETSVSMRRPFSQVGPKNEAIIHSIAAAEMANS